MVGGGTREKAQSVSIFYSPRRKTSEREGFPLCGVARGANHFALGLWVGCVKTPRRILLNPAPRWRNFAFAVIFFASTASTLLSNGSKLFFLYPPAPPHSMARWCVKRSRENAFFDLAIFTFSLPKNTQWISGCFLIYSSLMPCDILNFFSPLPANSSITITGGTRGKEVKKTAAEADAGKSRGGDKRGCDEQLLSRVALFSFF